MAHTGKWEPLVSREDFVTVQQILENNPSGFQHNKDEEARPLTRLLKCNDCGCYMVGYKSNQKNLHYYRCLKCNGVSVNAFTTVRAQRKGANEATLKSQMDSLEKKMKELKARYGLGDIDKETFNLTASHLNKQIGETAKELNTLASKISNLEKLIFSALKKLRNLHEIWHSSCLDMRRRIQKPYFQKVSYTMSKTTNI